MYHGNQIYWLSCLFPQDRRVRSGQYWNLFRLCLFLSDRLKPLEIVEVVALLYQGSYIVRSSWRQ